MAEKEKGKPPVFDKEALIDAAGSFGTTPEVMTGALYTIKEPITREQADKAVKDFLKRPIKE